MFLGGIFAGSSNNFQTGVESTSRQHNIQVGRIGGSSGDQALRPVNLRLTQGLLQRRVSRHYQPIFGSIALPLALGVVDDHKRNRLAGQLPSDAATHASHAADDEVAVETSDFALHAPPSEESLQLEF